MASRVSFSIFNKVKKRKWEMVVEQGIIVTGSIQNCSQAVLECGPIKMGENELL